MYTKLLKLIISNIVILLFLTKCSLLRASPAETSAFLSYPELLKPWYDRAPWDAVWSSDPGKIMVKTANIRSIYVCKINTQFLNIKKNADGKTALKEKLSDSDIQDMANVFRNDLIDAISTSPDTNLILIDKPEGADLVLEVALIELSPTRIAGNMVADLSSMVIPGSKIAEEAVAIGAQSAGNSLSSGEIAMEFKITSGKTGEILAEAKDREKDSATILPNVRDFEKYGWSRKIMKDWAKQFVEIFSTDTNTKISPASDISFFPW